MSIQKALLASFVIGFAGVAAFADDEPSLGSPAPLVAPVIAQIDQPAAAPTPYEEVQIPVAPLPGTPTPVTERIAAQPAVTESLSPVMSPSASEFPASTSIYPELTPGAVPLQAPVGIPLFEAVRYRKERNVAPCAVPMVVAVIDPCYNPKSCCEPTCVYVEICVPPCSECPPKVICRRKGQYVKYDFGRYEVEICSRNGRVTVDYERRLFDL